ncbi:hypothetical protein D3C86_849860 [compost metagenome]
MRIEFIIDGFSARFESRKERVEPVKTKIIEYGMLSRLRESRLSGYEELGVVF